MVLIIFRIDCLTNLLDSRTISISFFPTPAILFLISSLATALPELRKIYIKLFLIIHVAKHKGLSRDVVTYTSRRGPLI